MPMFDASMNWKTVTPAEVRVMIDAGADVNATDNFGTALLDIAKEEKKWNAVKVLEVRWRKII